MIRLDTTAVSEGMNQGIDEFMYGIDFEDLPYTETHDDLNPLVIPDIQVDHETW